MPQQPDFPTPPAGFELAHEEWLHQGPGMLHLKYLHGEQPEFYKTEYWRLVREAVFRRDCFLCYRCSNEAQQVHHLTYLHRGDDHFYPETLISVCKRCHVLVEHARSTQKVLHSLRYRLDCVNRILAYDDPRYENETPKKSLSRLLEYQARFDAIRAKYKRDLAEGVDEFKASNTGGDQAEVFWRRSFDKEADSILAKWKNSTDAKRRRIIRMIEKTIIECSAFVDDVQKTPLDADGGDEMTG